MNLIIVVFFVLLCLNTSWTIAILLIVGVLTFFLVNLIVRQESMLYVPCVLPGMQAPSGNPEGYRSPADRGLEFEDVYLKTSDDMRIHAWFMPAKEKPRTAPTLLFCHANAGNIGLRIPNFDQIIERLQANIFALDYRGYGHSTGTPSEAGLIEDALCAWQWLRTAATEGRIDGTQVFVFGRSLGGAVAVALACALRDRGEPLPAGILLENTFLSISALVNSLFPLIAFKSLKDRFLRLKWDTHERLSGLEVPLLFLCGEADEMVPHFHMQALKTCATKSPLKRMFVHAEAKHMDLWEVGGDAYWNVQAAFFKECRVGRFPGTVAALTNTPAALGGESRGAQQGAEAKAEVEEPATKAAAPAAPSEPEAAAGPAQAADEAAADADDDVVEEEAGNDG